MSARRIGAWLAVVAAAVVAVPTAPAALGQEAVEVEGTADFRNPPFLTDGLYTDTVVTGEEVWYAVVYRNNDPFRIEVAFAGSEPENVELSARFVGPTLGSVSEGRLLEGSARYDAGDVNVWYVTVRLDPVEGARLGVEHEIVLDVSGMQAADVGVCGEGCDLDDQAAALEAEVADLQALIDDFAANEGEAAVLADIAELESRIERAEGEIQAAESAIAEACAPETTCSEPPDIPPTTPAWAMALGIVAVLGGAGYVAMAVRGESSKPSSA